MRRLFRFLGGLLALVTMVGLLVGVPALLVRVGFPLEELRAVIGGELLSDSTRIQVVLQAGLVAIGWLAWVQVAWAIVVELAAGLRGRIPRSLRVLPGIQPMAHRLVAAALVITSLGGGASPALAQIPLGAAPTPVTATIDDGLVAPVPSIQDMDGNRFNVGSQPSDVSNPAHDRSQTPDRYRVVEGDSFWSIASDLTGDGLRWRELRHANVNNTMADGFVIDDNTEILRPGWVLKIPDSMVAESQGAASRGAGIGSGVSHSVVVEEGDHFWAMAETAVGARLGRQPTANEVGPYWAAMVEQNRDRLGPPGDPDIVHVGEVYQLPSLEALDQSAAGPTSRAPAPTDRVEPTRPAVNRAEVKTPPMPPESARIGVGASQGSTLNGGLPTDERTGPASQTPSVGVSTPAEPNRTVPTITVGPGKGTPSAPRDFSSNLTDIAVGAGGILLATGALLGLRRRRIFAMSVRPRWHRPADPDPRLAEMERILSAEADEERARWVNAALTSLAGRAAWPDEQVAVPVMMRIEEGMFSVTFDRPDPMAAPMPWRSEDSQNWYLPIDTPIESIPTFDRPSPVPATVSMSRSVLVNLEAVGTLHLSGRRQVVDEIVNSMVHELANSITGAPVDIRSTFEVPGTQRLGLVQQGSPEALAREVESWAASFGERLNQARMSSPHGFRLAHPSEVLAPMVVVADLASVPRLGAIADLASSGKMPLALVVADSSGQTVGDAMFNAGTRLRVTTAVSGSEGDDGMFDIGYLDPPGLELEPVRLSTRAATDIGQLLDSAQSQSTEILFGSAAQHKASQLQGSAPGSFIDDTIPRVQVLGHIEVTGIDEPLTSQQVSLIAFLSVAGPTGKERIIDALWDGQALSPSRLPNLLAEVRARIGRDHLPESINGRYELVGVSSDLEDFESLVIEARGTEEVGRRIELLQSALDLVTGVPFTPPSRRFWTWVGDHSHEAARTEALVADAASELAELQLQEANLEGAQRACEKGLSVSPLDERLVSHLTRVHISSGRVSAAHRLVTTWEASISRLNCGDPSDLPRRMLAS